MLMSSCMRALASSDRTSKPVKFALVPQLFVCTSARVCLASVRMGLTVCGVDMDMDMEMKGSWRRGRALLRKKMPVLGECLR